MRDVNADVDRALASGSARMEAIARETRARSRECRMPSPPPRAGTGTGTTTRGTRRRWSTIERRR